ncbi:dTDP-4-dehydrorhamnose reductase [Clostridia bacterium]|nr:dTDP-4-dehydrorhamnose reductase [Clostridia bacterium]
MRIIITGSKGQLGRQMYESLKHTHQVLALSKQDLDIGKTKELERLVRDYAPQVLINTAAYTRVDEAEKQADLAYYVNAKAPKAMAGICAARDILLLHYSTDYVFGGDQKVPYGELDNPAPLNLYGRSKREGERAVLDYPRSLVLRSSWLYGEGNNFLRTMLNLARKAKPIRVVSDQIGSPTSVTELSLVSNFLLEQYDSGELDRRSAYGLYHASCQGQTSWYGFAQKIFELAGKTVDLEAILTSEYPTLAKRPSYSVLQNNRLETVWNYHMQGWEKALLAFMQEGSQE